MANQNIDIYQALGVSRDASPQEIENAYNQKKNELDKDFEDKQESNEKLQKDRKWLSKKLDEAVKNYMDMNLRQEYKQALQQSSMQVQGQPQPANTPTQAAGSANAGAQFVLDVSGKDLQDVTTKLKGYVDSKKGVLQQDNQPLSEEQEKKLELGGQLFQATMDPANNSLQISFPNSLSCNEFSRGMAAAKILRLEDAQNTPAAQQQQQATNQNTATSNPASTDTQQQTNSQSAAPTSADGQQQATSQNAANAQQQIASAQNNPMNPAATPSPTPGKNAVEEEQKQQSGPGAIPKLVPPGAKG